MHTLTRAGALSAVAAAALLVSPAAAHATDSGDNTYSVQLRQQLPRTATTADGGAPRQGRDQCPGVPDGQDGWHFVLPGKSSDFVKLTVTFEPGGQQVVTDFGPPSDKHAYVWSLPGAELTSAVAEVRGGDLELFNLSHTCPVTGGTTPGGSDDTGGDTDEGGSEEETDGTTPSATPSETAEGSEAPAASPGASEEGAAPAVSSAPSAAPSAQGGGAEGDLAKTGSSAPVGLLAGAAAALLAAGGYLVFRRRKSGADQG
ncbi:LPXTG cell wall anchor domain-containing protein [Streptomyces sp. TRM70350]|uniref:LPXTG cell wall anchor domain-containing protein n=1 Tax=Streptomyces sp. TRM70350 TaxID=2856165 RepID=UPI001C464601|nr:LPXTG cell wall anchor domain-containing protein [Streptomyces sp. TRM70350]MBV7699651.1 LPXTG cell wall anchor domain-containing protein [Streptomyces sp. TRM70350]